MELSKNGNLEKKKKNIHALLKVLPETYKMTIFHYIPTASGLVPSLEALLQSCCLGWKSHDKTPQPLPAALEGIWL